MAHVQHQQAGAALDVTKSPSVLKLQPAPVKRRALARHGSLQPQENDDDDDDSDATGQSDATVDSEKEELASDPPLRRLSDRCQVKIPACLSVVRAHDTVDARPATPTTLLPELQLVCSLSRRIARQLTRARFTQQQLEDDEDQDPYEEDDETESLAGLYCQRAQTLLRYATFDASVRIPLALLETLDPELLVQGESQLFVAPDGLDAIQQALDDALAAIASDPRAADAYYVAAQCQRSAGDSHAAIELVESALRLTPQRKPFHTLLRQLQRETDVSRFVLAPPLLCHSTCVNDNPDDHQQQQNDDDENEALDDDHRGFSADVQTCFQQMEALARSSLLSKLESMRHETLHHQCASTDEALALTAAANETVALLQLLLDDPTETTSRAISMEPHVLHDTATQLTSMKRLVETPALRRWLVRSLAPAVVASLRDGHAEPNGVVRSDAPSSRAALLRDVLLTLARLLLATGSLQRCTNVSLALATSKTALDLTLQLSKASDSSVDDPDTATPPPAFRRLAWACKDAYALALLDLAEESGEALLLHQETLDAALRLDDRDRELTSRYLLGRALFHMREVTAARTEFAALLAQSQALGDSAMTCLALYMLGECDVADGDVDDAMRHFEHARVVCHQTAHCHGTWRAASIQRAIDFYACMRRPTRRAAMRRGSLVNRGARKATLVVAPSLSLPLSPTTTLVEQDSTYWAWTDEQDADDGMAPRQPQARRAAAVWMTAPGTSAIETPRRTLAETVLGGYDGEDCETSEPMATEDETEVSNESGPLTTHGVTLTSWLIRQSSMSPTRPECCKPVE